MIVQEQIFVFTNNKYIVNYSITPPEKRNSGHPDNRLPDEPLEVEIVSVTLNGIETDLPSNHIHKVLTAIEQHWYEAKYAKN